MKEIGGYFEFEQYTGKAYYENVIAFNCARNALLYYLNINKIEKILLPYYLCGEVADTCLKNHVAVSFYFVNKDFLPIISSDFRVDNLLYLTNYYGMLSDETIREFGRKYKNVIVDNVQAFFRKPVDHISTIYSCRKFFGVPDGAYLYSEILINNDLEKETAKDRIGYMLGRFEQKNANLFFQEYQESSLRFNHGGIKSISDFSKNILSGIDYEYVKNTRSNNYNFLNSALSSKNAISPGAQEGAFAYPFMAGINAADIRKKMIQEKIYISTLWNNVLDMSPDTIEYQYASQILPLPCDQRYTLDDMEYVVNILSDML